jgi:aryl carrier-like protein
MYWQEHERHDTAEKEARMNAISDKERMKLLWEEIFNDAIRDDENFFERGDSLTALILLASIEKEIGVRLNFVQLVEAPTIRQLISVVATAKTVREVA